MVVTFGLSDCLSVTVRVPDDLPAADLVWIGREKASEFNTNPDRVRICVRDREIDPTRRIPVAFCGR